MKPEIIGIKPDGSLGISVMNSRIWVGERALTCSPTQMRGPSTLFSAPDTRQRTRRGEGCGKSQLGTRIFAHQSEVSDIINQTMEEKPDENQGNASSVEQLAPSSHKPAALTEEEKQTRRRLVYIALGALVIVAALVAATVILLEQPADTTGKVRDVFIIFMALESLVIGAALVILIIQLSILTNLLQNEIKPILNSTNETVNTLRGTAVFLSDNLAEPIMKLNEYLAGLKKLVDLFRLGRK